MKTKLSIKERRRINFYKLCIDIINNNPHNSNYICYISIDNNCQDIPEYMLFKDTLFYSFLEIQVIRAENIEIITDLVSFKSNEYRIFILQLCIEMIKNK